MIREGLRKMETEDTKLDVLRKILAEGEQDIKEGRFVTNYSYEDLMRDIDQRIMTKNN